MGVGGKPRVPAALPPGPRTSTYFIGVSIGPRMVLDCAENLARTGIDPRTVQ